VAEIMGCLEGGGGGSSNGVLDVFEDLPIAIGGVEGDGRGSGDGVLDVFDDIPVAPAAVKRHDSPQEDSLIGEVQVDVVLHKDLYVCEYLDVGVWMVCV